MLKGTAIQTLDFRLQTLDFSKELNTYWFIETIFSCDCREMMIHVLFVLLKGWNFFFHSLMSEVYGLLSESQ